MLHLVGILFPHIYSNIPIKETKQILKNMLASNMSDHKTSSEILKCYEVITAQNYFAYGDRIITQTDGLAIGESSLGLYLRFSYNTLNTPTSPSWPTNTN